MREVHGVEIIPCEIISYQIEKLKKKKEKKPQTKARLKQKVFQDKWDNLLEEVRINMEEKYNTFFYEQRFSSLF